MEGFKGLVKTERGGLCVALDFNISEVTTKRWGSISGGAPVRLVPKIRRALIYSLGCAW